MSRRRVAHVATDLVSQMVAARLSAGARLVLLTLAVDPTTTTVGVSASGSDALAIATGQPVSSVRRALAELDDAGFIVRDIATGEIFVTAVVTGSDRAHQDHLKRLGGNRCPGGPWWVDTGIRIEPSLAHAGIASDRIRETAAATIRQVAS